MLLFPNALCCSLYERNCVCAVTNIFTKFLPANNCCQLLRVTRKRSCTFAGNAQAQLHFRDDQQRAFGISNISNCLMSINHCPLIVDIGLLRCDIKHAFVIFSFVLFCFCLFVLVIHLVYFVIYYRSRTIVIFGILEDDSLEINISALNNCFSHRNIFQNGVNTLSKMVNHFLSKSSKFFVVRTVPFRSNFTSILIK